MKDKKQVKVYAFISGDLFHYNHLRFLQNCRKLGDYLVVGVVPTSVVEQYKRRPIIAEKERVAIVKGLKCVDEVVMHDVLNPLPIIKQVKPDIIVHGNDWKKMPFQKEIKAMGIKVVFPQYLKGVTTTKIIQKILRERKPADKKDEAHFVEK